MEMVHDILVSAMMLIGGIFCCIAGLGIYRLPDVIMRMHASTKASTLGAGLIIAAVAIDFAKAEVVMPALSTIAFLLITAPVSAHLLAKEAYRTRVPLWEGMWADELKDYVDKQQAEKCNCGPTNGTTFE